MICRSYELVDSIKVFESCEEDSKAFYDVNGFKKHADVEKDHFWFRSRAEFIVEQIKPYLKNKKCIDIGSGTGLIPKMLMDEGISDIAAGDIFIIGLKYLERKGVKDLCQFNLLDSPFKEHFDMVMMFDVLEHIQSHQIAVQKIYEMLKLGGRAVVTVPAHMCLWNRTDIEACHARRYNKAGLSSLFINNGFKIVCSRYFFISITPLLLLRKFMERLGYKSEPLNGLYINPLLNRFLYAICKIENSINKYLPNVLGGSIFLIVEK